MALSSSSSSWNSFPNSGDSSRLIDELLEDSALSKPLSPSLTFLFLINESIDLKMTPVSKYSREFEESFGIVQGGRSLFGSWFLRF